MDRLFDKLILVALQLFHKVDSYKLLSILTIYIYIFNHMIRINERFPVKFQNHLII